MESSASLDREITNPKELRNLDEFLGNQVQGQVSGLKSSQSQSEWTQVARIIDDLFEIINTILKQMDDKIVFCSL